MLKQFYSSHPLRCSHLTQISNFYSFPVQDKLEKPEVFRPEKWWHPDVIFNSPILTELHKLHPTIPDTLASIIRVTIQIIRTMVHPKEILNPRLTTIIPIMWATLRTWNWAWNWDKWPWLPSSFWPFSYWSFCFSSAFWSVAKWAINSLIFLQSLPKEHWIKGKKIEILKWCINFASILLDLLKQRMKLTLDSQLLRMTEDPWTDPCLTTNWTPLPKFPKLLLLYLLMLIPKRNITQLLNPESFENEPQ